MNEAWQDHCKVAAICKKQTTYEQCNAHELTTMVSWYKQPQDSKIPSTTAKLIVRYLMMCNRMEHEWDRKKLDEDAVLEDANEAAAIWVIIIIILVIIVIIITT